MEYFSKDELLALLQRARSVRERDFLMILVAYCHALRATEVVSLTASCVHDGKLTTTRLKGSLKTTQVLRSDPNPLLDEATALVDYCRNQYANQRIFPISKRRFEQIVAEHGKAVGISREKLHPHALKHTLGHELIENMPINIVQKYMGHKSMNSTAQYLKVSDQEASDAVTKNWSNSEKG